MALPAYDPTKHHIGLGIEASDHYGIQIEGGSQKLPQRQPAPPEFGGQRDLIADNPSLSRWTQDDFSGGIFQELWGEDTAMFWDSRGFLPSLISKSVRTVPPMRYWSTTGAIDARLAIAIFASGAYINVVYDTTTSHYDIEAGTLTSTSTTTRPVQAAAHDPTDDQIYSVQRLASSSEPSTTITAQLTKTATSITATSTASFESQGVLRINGETIYYTGKTAGSFTGLVRAREGTRAKTHANGSTITFQRRYELRRYSKTAALETIGYFPNGAVGPAYGIEMAGKDFIAAIGRTVWLCDVNDARTATRFTRIGRLPGRWIDSIAYNGVIYILVRDNEGRSSVYSWDGSQLLPVVVFPYNFRGKTICEYGGRFYVGGSGTDISGDDRYAELHEVLASSQRVVFSLADQARGARDVPTTVNALTVHEGLLFIGTDKQWLLAFDVTRDSLFGGPIIVPTGTGRTVFPMHLLSTREKLFAWCEDAAGAGVGTADGFYRLVTDDSEYTAATDNYIETSDFAPEPDRLKVWSTLRVLTRRASGTPAEPFTFEYSTDGGASWTTLGSSSDTDGPLVTTTVNLNWVPISRMVRFRLSWEVDTIVYTELLAFTLQFAFCDTGKHSWRFTVLAVDQPEQVDQSSVAYDFPTLATELWSWFNNKSLLEFTDVDGSEYYVRVTDINETRPVVGPRISGERESFLAVTLTES